VVGRIDRTKNLASSLLRGLSRLTPVKLWLRLYVEIDLGGPVSFGAHSYIVDAFTCPGVSILFDKVIAEWLKPELEKVPVMEPSVFVYDAKVYSKSDIDDFNQTIEKRS
jgi:iron complex transport system substrate-binding protein